MILAKINSFEKPTSRSQQLAISDIPCNRHRAETFGHGSTTLLESSGLLGRRRADGIQLSTASSTKGHSDVGSDSQNSTRERTRTLPTVLSTSTQNAEDAFDKEVSSETHKTT